MMNLDTQNNGCTTKHDKFGHFNSIKTANPTDRTFLCNHDDFILELAILCSRCFHACVTNYGCLLQKRWLHARQRLSFVLKLMSFVSKMMILAL